MIYISNFQNYSQYLKEQKLLDILLHAIRIDTENDSSIFQVTDDYYDQHLMLKDFFERKVIRNSQFIQSVSYAPKVFHSIRMFQNSNEVYIDQYLQQFKKCDLRISDTLYFIKDHYMLKGIREINLDLFLQAKLHPELLGGRLIGFYEIKAPWGKFEFMAIECDCQPHKSMVNMFLQRD
ncbi:BA75_01028T0 [Komagataella pastoris]|uniref:BA75_01028T0 n=1 Tax=Komagataella pastoris TaxID=4922 RepID=A0A1B2J859_PICPA|nr:BA75_01028T0 [Komagataella pastoris]